MITIPLNGARLRVRLIEAEVSRLKLDPENPRLHSAYLTHDLPARPNEKQIAAVLEQLPEFQALLDAITRNDGVFQPPLLTADFRVLEGNRRVTALRKLHAAEPKNAQWRTVTAHQLGARLPAEQERALRAKFHLDHVESQRISSVGTFNRKASPIFYLLSLSLYGYPDVQEREGRGNWPRPIGLPPAAALRSLSSVALSSEQANATLSGLRRIFQVKIEASLTI